MPERNKGEENDNSDGEENEDAVIPPRRTARPLFQHSSVMLPCI
jgi:hypothetical protein